VLGLSNLQVPDTLILRDRSIHTTAEEMRSAMREGRHTTALLDAFATVVAYQVGRRASNAAQTLLSDNVSPLRTPQLARIDNFISEHLSEPIKLAQLADLVGLSQWHFIRRFKVTRGVAPSAYLVSRRIQHAQKLLRGTTLSVTEIALEVGMSSSHLSRTFQFQVRVSPSAYRKLWRD
jgi:AraC family transcriptional regulator